VKVIRISLDDFLVMLVINLHWFSLSWLPSSGAEVRNVLIFTFTFQVHGVMFRHRDHTTSMVSLIGMK
jgi:hypothetical protein